MKNPSKSFVYALIDPRNNELRYVGKTYRLKERIYDHLHHVGRGDQTYKARWLRLLVAEGLDPIVLTLAYVLHVEAAALEVQYIKTLRGYGVRLTNLTDGGDGTPGLRRAPVSDATRKKISAANTGKRHSRETRALWSKQRRGRRQAPEHTAAIARSNRLFTEDEERQIADEYAHGRLCTQVDLAKKYGVSRHAIHRLLKRIASRSVERKA